MGFDDGRLIFDHENLTYNAGEVVHGKVVFNQERVKTFRGMYAKIKGYCDVHWTTRHTRRVNDRDEHYTVEHTSHETYFEQKVYLKGAASGEVTLNPGHHEFPFQCMIPPHVPSSFEGSNGHVRYEVKVVVDRAFKFDQEKKMQLRVINQKNLNMDPLCKEVIEFDFEETYCCWCMSQGNCETTVKLPQSGYCPGQTINFECRCANNSSVEMNSIHFELIEHRKFTAIHNSDTRSEKQVLASLKKGPVASNTTRNWTLEMDIPQMDVYNLDACQYIDIYHQFKVTVSPSGCHTESDQKRRIILGHIPLREFEGPPTQGDQVVSQPVAPSMTQYPGSPAFPNQYPSPIPMNNYPNGNIPFPTPNEGVNPPYPGANPPYPGANPPYPGANPPYPGANPPYPGTNSPFPGANPPYPGANPPYASPLPGVSPYPVGNNPTPTQPGFVGDAPAAPLLPNPYPPNAPVVTSTFAASAPPGTPDFDKNSSPFNPEFEKK